jgi:hypothetical protein
VRLPGTAERSLDDNRHALFGLANDVHVFEGFVLHAMAGEMGQQVIPADHSEIPRLGRSGVPLHRLQEGGDGAAGDGLTITVKCSK